MKRFKMLSVLLASIVVCLVIVGGKAQGIEPPEIVDGRFIIMMKNEQGVPADLDTAVSDAGGKIVSTMSQIGVAVATSEADAFSEKLKSHKDVMCVVPELRIQWVKDDFGAEGITPEDEDLYPDQWNMHIIDAEGAWEAGYAGNGARVAILDSGIDYWHPDLISNIDAACSVSFIPYDPINLPDYLWFIDQAGHGTHVSGIVAAADNGEGVIGVAPEATIIVVKVLTVIPGLPGSWGNFSWIINGVIYATIVADADIINMSLGGYFPKSGHVPEGWPPLPAREAAFYLSIWNRVLNFASQQGVTVVCAAANDSIDLNHDHEWVVLPAQAGNCMAVSATGPVSLVNPDTPAFYTNYGTSVIDVAAPGGNIDLSICPNPPCDESIPWRQDMVLSTYPGNEYRRACGTSMAAPHVCGVAALIVGKHNRTISPAQVKAIIQQSADDLGKPGRDDFYGCGRINAYKAVSGVKK